MVAPHFRFGALTTNTSKEPPNQGIWLSGSSSSAGPDAIERQENKKPLGEPIGYRQVGSQRQKLGESGGSTATQRSERTYLRDDRWFTLVSSLCPDSGFWGCAKWVLTSTIIHPAAAHDAPAHPHNPKSTSHRDGHPILEQQNGHRKLTSGIAGMALPDLAQTSRDCDVPLQDPLRSSLVTL